MYRIEMYKYKHDRTAIHKGIIQVHKIIIINATILSSNAFINFILLC